MRLASRALERRPQDGRRRNEKPKMTWQKDTLKDLETMGIDWSDKITAVSNGANWRHIADQCSTWNRRNKV